VLKKIIDNIRAIGWTSKLLSAVGVFVMILIGLGPFVLSHAPQNLPWTSIALIFFVGFAVLSGLLAITFHPSRSDGLSELVEQLSSVLIPADSSWIQTCALTLFPESMGLYFEPLVSGKQFDKSAVNLSLVRVWDRNAAKLRVIFFGALAEVAVHDDGRKFRFEPSVRGLSLGLATVFAATTYATTWLLNDRDVPQDKLLVIVAIFLFGAAGEGWRA
jgi:hypothetical protein